MEEQIFKNDYGVPLAMAVWLADDTYDTHEEIENYISATELIRPIRQIVLRNRVGAVDQELRDITSRMPSAMGNAVHNAIELAWVERYALNMKRLGYPQQVIDRIRINPKPEELTDDVIPVYLEQRAFRKVGKYTIGGQFDFIGDGALEDFKTTGVFTYMSGSNDWKYQLQLSIYRWLNPDLVTAEHGAIDYQFTDWSKRDSMIRKDKGYPPFRIFQQKITLKSVPEIDVWIHDKLDSIDRFIDADEKDLPLCEKKDLWQDEPTYKYYKNPTNRNRATKNFDTQAEAAQRLIKDGNVGVVVTVPGEAKACKYCEAFDVCTQKDDLIAAGALKL